MPRMYLAESEVFQHRWRVVAAESCEDVISKLPPRLYLLRVLTPSALLMTKEARRHAFHRAGFAAC